MAHPNVELLKEYSEAWTAGDMDAVKSMYTDDITLRLPGRSRFSGVYRGKDEVFEFFDKLAAHVDSFRFLEMKEILADDARAVMITREELHHGANVIDAYRVLIYEFRDQRISGIRTFEYDQYAIDEFFDSGEVAGGAHHV